jgi:hypothetical protein
MPARNISRWRSASSESIRVLPASYPRPLDVEPDTAG